MTTPARTYAPDRGNMGATPNGVAPTPGTNGIPTGLNPTGQDAYAALQSVLAGWGLGTLASAALGFIKAGYDSSTTQYLLTQTPEYATRFSGNADRIKAGLAPLSPANYIATEDSYRQVMAAAGLPKNFYDSNESLAGFIGNDMSPAELQSRVTMASTLANQTDPNTRDALNQMYGITAGHLTAHFLDPQTTAPILQKQEQAAQIGGAALAQHLGLTSVQTAETAADRGMTGAQAQSAYGKIAQFLPTEQAIGQRFGVNYTQQSAENEMLLGDGAATTQRETLNKDEQAQFQGETGLASTFYGGQTRAASLAGSPSGNF